MAHHASALCQADAPGASGTEGHYLRYSSHPLILQSTVEMPAAYRLVPIPANGFHGLVMDPTQ